MTVYQVVLDNIPLLEKKVAKVNKIAAKLGCPPVVVTMSEIKFKEIVKATEDGRQIKTGEYVEYYDVEIVGSAPIIAGWKFIGTLSHDYKDAVLRAVPNEVIPAKYFTATPDQCDHCNKIRQRRDTYVVQNIETGETKQVGKSCVRDFLGHNNPENIGKYLDYIADIGSEDFDEDRPFARNRLNVPIMTLAGHIARCLRVYGFVSRKAAESNKCWATADAVELSYDGEKGTEPNKKVFKEPPTAEDFEVGKKGIEFLRNEMEVKSEFQHNIKTIANNDYIAYRDIGMTAYGMQSWLQAKEMAVKEQKAKENRKPSEYVGKVGERIVAKVKVEFHTTFEGAFGTTHLFKMADENDNVFAWFGSGDAKEVLGNLKSRDEFVTIKGTVKKQEVYKDVKQTMLTRVAIFEEKVKK
jgi:hypothetical protein